MAVKVRIPEALRTLTAGADLVQVQAATVQEMLDALETQHKGFKERILDEKGQVRRFVNIFVNEEDIRFQDNLSTVLPDGTEVSILPAVAGGAAKARKAPVAAKLPDGTKVVRVYLTFDEKTTVRPMIYELIKKFDVVPNIRTASCQENMAIMSLSLSGPEDALDRSIQWLRKEGVRVDPVEMNVVEP